MKAKEVFLVMCSTSEDYTIKPRIAKNEETAMEIKEQMIKEILDEYEFSIEELEMSVEYGLEITDYSFTIHSQDFSFYISIFVECLEVE